MEKLTGDTLPKLLMQQAERFGHRKHALREKDYGIWQSFTWQEYYDHVKYFCLGMVSLGLKRDDKISIIGDNRPEWIYAELSAQSIGAVPVGIYQDSILKEVSYIINLSRSKIIVAEDQEQCDKILDMLEELPSVEYIIYHDPKGMRTYDEPKLLYFPDVEEMGRRYEKEHPGFYEEQVAATKSEDVAAICTTSGTTGNPKLSMLSHLNMVSMAHNLGEVDKKYETDEFVSFLPLPWIGEQMMAISSALLFGFTVNFPEKPETAQDNVREIGPHVMFSPPRVWENMAAMVQVKIMDASPFKRFVYNKCLPIGYHWADLKFQKKTPTFMEKCKYFIAYWLVFRALKDRLGFSHIRSASTGGAALGPDTFRFFHALGVNISSRSTARPRSPGFPASIVTEISISIPLGCRSRKPRSRSLRRARSSPAVHRCFSATMKTPKLRPRPSAMAGSIPVMPVISRRTATWWSSTGSRMS